MKKIIKFLLLLLIIVFIVLTVLSLIERSGSENLSDTEVSILKAVDRTMLQIKNSLGSFGDDAENAWFKFKEFIGGWKISPSEVKEKIEQGIQYIFLDVRSATEFKVSHIPEVINLPFSELEANAEEVIGSKSKFIFVYGGSDNQSAEAVRKLRSLGYSNALDLGDIDNWPYELLIG